MNFILHKKVAPTSDPGDEGREMEPDASADFKAVEAAVHYINIFISVSSFKAYNLIGQAPCGSIRPGEEARRN